MQLRLTDLKRGKKMTWLGAKFKKRCQEDKVPEFPGAVRVTTKEAVGPLGVLGKSLYFYWIH